MMAKKVTDVYQSPLIGRYCSDGMKKLFSDDVKFSNWRKLWTVLAKAEKDAGLEITDRQINELNEHISDINYDIADAREKIVRHDVMAHVYAYGVQCTNAAGIIHLGATSCFVTDNTDILKLNEGINIIKSEIVGVIKLLSDFSLKWKDTPTLGFTHYQPAALTTVGKRASLWLYNFMESLSDLEYVQSTLKMLGCRGATGSQDTFMELFDGNEEKANEIDSYIAKSFGFESVYPVSGQTYPRIVDSRVLNCLSTVLIAAYKMANDIRLLQHDGEMAEPFVKSQIGSSAMAYKRNPMLCERVCSLARYGQNEISNAIETANVQWLERTLDDSANRRLSLPETFLSTDAVLLLCAKIVDGLTVFDKVIEKHLKEELPFMITERIIMKGVKAGGNRQDLHERIRVHSQAAKERIVRYGESNDLVSRIANDPTFKMSVLDIDELMDPTTLVGLCPQQVESYIEKCVKPVLKKYSNYLSSINTNAVTV